MAIAKSDIKIVNMLAGWEITDGRLNDVFNDCQSGGPVELAWVEIRNTNVTLTWTSPKAWLGVDLGGATVSMGVADAGTARALTFGYNNPAAPGAYTTPTDFASGLALPTLAAQQKCLVTLRRDPTGAAVAYPENNILYVRGTSPI